MLNRLDVRRTTHRLLACYTPVLTGLFRPAGLVAMLGKPFRLCGDDLREFRLNRRCNVRMELLSLMAQKAAICCVSDKRMIEQISRVRRHAPPEQQTGRNELVQRQSQLRFRLGHHPSQQGMREFAPDRSPDLRYLLGAAEPVEPRRRSPPPAPPWSSPPRTRGYHRYAR